MRRTMATVKHLFYGYRDQRGPQGYHARCLQLPALKNMHYSVGPVDKQTYAHSRQSHSHQQRGERLELAVAVWMTLVVLATRYRDEGENYYVGHRIGQRMDGVCYHGRAIAHRSGYEFTRGEEYVYRQTYKCNFAGLFDFLHLTYRNFVQIYVFIETSSCETCVFMFRQIRFAIRDCMIMPQSVMTVRTTRYIR